MSHNRGGSRGGALGARAPKPMASGCGRGRSEHDPTKIWAVQFLLHPKTQEAQLLLGDRATRKHAKDS